MLKSLHILGVVLLLGNSIISAVWRMRAQRSDSKDIHLFSIKVLKSTDLFFSVPGILLLISTGHMLAAQIGGMAAHGWIHMSYTLLAVSIIIWLAGLLPLQRKQLKLLNETKTLKEAGIRYETANKWWLILTSLSTACLIAGLYLMIARPA